MGFTASTHEPCLYKATINGELALFLRQVDDFAIATMQQQTADHIISEINKHLRLPIHNLGVISRYNGVDIEQTKFYVKLHCSKYLNKMLSSHGWLNSPPTRLPFPSDNQYLKQLQEAATPSTEHEQRALEHKMGFKYRQLMGEILYPMVKCRPDISTHTIILSQYSNNPGEIHYSALKTVAQYLANTINDGIYYWRREPHPILPPAAIPIPHADNYTLKEQRGTDSSHLVGYVDSDWAAHTTKRTSLSGIVLMYAGGAVGYKTKYQPVIAHSTTEAEFVAACDAAKMILFYRSIMEEIGIPQENATVLFEDNNGALMMANAQQPTRRTRHMEIKHFALLDWVERDLITLERISTHDNAADAMTKTLSKQLFERHFDTYMGIRIPNYIRSNTELVQYGTQHSHPLFVPYTHNMDKTIPAKRTAQSMGGGTGPTYII